MSKTRPLCSQWATDISATSAQSLPGKIKKFIYISSRKLLQVITCLGPLWQLSTRNGPSTPSKRVQRTHDMRVSEAGTSVSPAAGGLSPSAAGGFGNLRRGFGRQGAARQHQIKTTRWFLLKKHRHQHTLFALMASPSPHGT